MSEPLLRVVDLHVSYPVRRAAWRRHTLLRAVAGVDLEVRAGEALGIVGESGCGKSTVARAILSLVGSVAGRILWQGRDIHDLSGAERQRLRRDLQIIFQNPLASLDPRMPLVESIGEPLRVHRADLDGRARARAVHDLLRQMGLAENLAYRYPHELSGGQGQRAAIARAMILQPKLLVCDEAVSALDAAIQAQIIELLRAVKENHAVALLFISHNLAVVRELCDRVLVLYLGRMMEAASVALLYARPLHPYTRGLFEAIPVADPDIQPARLTHVMAGEPPSALNPPRGCVFHTRCPYVIPLCRREIPAWEPAGEGRYVACHRWREI
jgi:oligopeptide/dipeptide ABC transporter ATP-binding protein